MPNVGCRGLTPDAEDIQTRVACLSQTFSGECSNYCTFLSRRLGSLSVLLTRTPGEFGRVGLAGNLPYPLHDTSLRYPSARVRVRRPGRPVVQASAHGA